MDLKLFIMVPVLIIILIVMFPLMDTLSAQLFTALDSTTTVYYVPFIKLLVAALGLALVLGVIIKLVRSLQAPPSATYNDWS